MIINNNYYNICIWAEASMRVGAAAEDTERK